MTSTYCKVSSRKMSRHFYKR